MTTCNHDGFEEFDNEWDYIASLPEDSINSFSAQEVLWKAGSWDLPKAYACIVRCQDPSTGKVEERCFKNKKRAESFIGKQETIGYEVTCYSDETLYYSPGFAALGLEDE